MILLTKIMNLTIPKINKPTPLLHIKCWKSLETILTQPHHKTTLLPKQIELKVNQKLRKLPKKVLIIFKSLSKIFLNWNIKNFQTFYWILQGVKVMIFKFVNLNLTSKEKDNNLWRMIRIKEAMPKYSKPMS